MNSGEPESERYRIRPQAGLFVDEVLLNPKDPAGASATATSL